MIKIIPQKQLISHDPDNGKFGDCYRTCVAIILGLHPSEVPHVCDKGWDNEEDLDGIIAMRNWLRTKDYAISKSVFNGNLNWNQFKNWMKQLNPDTAFIVTGCTIRETNHCVVMIGENVICDPITGKSNKNPFSGPAKASGEEYWWVEVITKRYIS